MSELKVYSTQWCGSCMRLMAQLEREGIPFVKIDIEQDPEAADFVASRNRGNHFVPTVLMPDGVTLPNPPVSVIKAHLAKSV